MDDTLVLIDAGFLSKISFKFGDGKYLIYDIIRFAQNLARRQKLICKNIFYYTAPPFQSEPPTKMEINRKEGYDKFIKKLSEGGVIVREGRCQRLRVDGEFTFKQKAVDVLLAMDLTNIPLKYPKIKRIILVSSDTDFVPVINNLEKQGVKTILYTFYEKKRNTIFSRNNELIKSVYKYVLLKKEDFIECPLKDNHATQQN